MAGGFDRDRAARILVDAIALGDRTAADRHQVAERTIVRYRQRLSVDHELSDIVRRLTKESEQGWHVARSRFLRRGLEKLMELVEAAGVSNLKDVTEALRVVGELEIAREALGVSTSDRREDPPHAAPSGSVLAEEPTGGSEGRGSDD
jgi:hypothetical protein